MISKQDRRRKNLIEFIYFTTIVVLVVLTYFVYNHCKN
jgi:predicted nucleic acid-binding Zn ribbon protein